MFGLKPCWGGGQGSSREALKGERGSSVHTIEIDIHDKGAQKPSQISCW